MSGRFRRLTDLSGVWQAAGWYLVCTIVMTWPLAINITRDIPGDLGDPLLVCWALARGAEHWLALLSGDLGAVTRFWQAGMFHPEPDVTAYSEHFALHALQILPVWMLTKNVILCYNLLFFSSFVVGGTGMYLLARELTGSARGAFVAGLMFVFTPYRFYTLAHLQVLSSQWMPWALYGLRRYFVTGRLKPLSGAAAAILLQNLSSGYYLIYFAPLVALYAVCEMWARGLVMRWQVWRNLIIAGLVTLALTLPFSIPYIMLQRRLNYRRPLAEVQTYSADLLSWLTALPTMNVWGWLQTYPKPEGALFPGSMIVVCAVIGLVSVWRRSDDSREVVDHARSDRMVATFGLGACAFAAWMALGPTPTLAGEPLGLPAIYRLFYDYVPGFNVSRVPARFTTLMVLCLAITAAYGTAWLDRSHRRVLLLAVGLGVLLDGASLPLRRNLVFSTSTEITLPDPRVYPRDQAPAIWNNLKTLPADAVLAHFPFGYPEYELRYLYYSQVDGHRLSNGYSGAFPLSYMSRSAVLQRTIQVPARSVDRLRADGVSHVIVHADYWPDDTGAQTVAALERAGLHVLTRVGPSYVMAVPPAP